MATRPLSRNELAARISTLETVLEILWDVTACTGGEPFLTIGRAKVEACGLRNQLWEMDRQAEKGEPMPLEVACAAALQSVEVSR